MTRTIATLALIGTLAACSPAADQEAPMAEGTQPAQQSVSRPRPALLPEDIEAAALGGELGCSFAEQDAAAPLLVAMADVRDAATADGVMKLGPSTARLRAAEPGGFNAMVDGERFISGDLTATVAITSAEPLGGGESPPRSATLTLESAAFAPQQVTGQWTCGP